jgi:MIP family channel proteins
MSNTWLTNAIAEAVGTFALVFVGVMAINNADSLTAVALAFGLVIFVMVAALGHVSGGHFNPAVTFAFLLSRHIDRQMATVYWVAQVVGATIASIFVVMLSSRDAVKVGTPVLGDDVNVLQGILLEAIATFFLVLVVFGTVVDRRAPAAAYPLAIGLTIGVAVFAIGPQTGAALNPARALGPALVGGEWSGILAWFLGPIMGAGLAWALHTFVIAPQPAVSTHRH